MISICIPVFNYDVRPLVKSLHQQATDAAIHFEILLMDDASQETFKHKNKECKTLNNVLLRELESNVGRSRIRNLLAQKARYQWIIFMDCDSTCPDALYIHRYIEHAKGEGVICGGRSYRPQPPTDQTYLHWLFGNKREVKHHYLRSKKPYHSFMTNNFMISSNIMRKIGFNENLLGYGHEDTLFGLELFTNNTNIIHIENPLLHVGLQSADEFLAKTSEGTSNLLNIYRMTIDNKTLVKMVRLLKVWLILRKLHLCMFVGALFRYFEPAMVENLKSHHPKLFILDLYKLGTICIHWKARRKSLQS